MRRDRTILSPRHLYPPPPPVRPSPVTPVTCRHNEYTRVTDRRLFLSPLQNCAFSPMHVRTTWPENWTHLPINTSTKHRQGSTCVVLSPSPSPPSHFMAVLDARRRHSRPWARMRFSGRLQDAECARMRCSGPRLTYAECARVPLESPKSVSHSRHHFYPTRLRPSNPLSPHPRYTTPSSTNPNCVLENVRATPSRYIPLSIAPISARLWKIGVPASYFLPCSTAAATPLPPFLPLFIYSFEQLAFILNIK